MPKAPRFQTDSAQQIAVGVVTFIVLVISIGLAQFYTQAHQIEYGAQLSDQHVDALQLKLPATWLRTDVKAGEIGFAGSPAVLADPQIPGRRLIVGRVEAPTPRKPEDVLRDMLNRIAQSRSRVFIDKDRLRRFRSGSFTAAYYHAQSQSDPDAAVFSDRVVVLTEDGRRHWLIAITMPLNPNTQVGAAQDDLLMSIVRSAVDSQYRAVTAAELQTRDLSPLKDIAKGLRLRSGSSPDEPLHMVISDENIPNLGLIRLRSTLDSQITQPKAPYSPDFGLARVFADIHGRDPDPSEIISEQMQGQPVVRLRISDGKEGLLLREMFYFPTRNHRGLLFDVLAESPAWQACEQAMLAAVLIAKASSDTTQGRTLEDAIARGDELAQAQRRLMTQQFVASSRASIIFREGVIIGTQLDDRRHLPDKPLPLRARRVRSLVHEGDSMITWAGWYSSLDGDRIDSTLFNEIKEGPVERSYAYQVVLRDESLALSLVPPKQGRDPLWTLKEPKGYMPGLAEEMWDLAALKKLTASGPVLIWRGKGIVPPAPHLLHQVEVGSLTESEKTNVPKGAVTLVVIRPMMGMDAEEYWVDGQGRFLTARWTDSARLPTGGTHLSLVGADLDTVIRIFPKNREILLMWQNEDKKND